MLLKTKIMPILAVCCGLLLASAAGAQGAQALRENLFKQVDETLAAAIEVRANVLAPSNFAEAAKLYRRAEENLERGRSIDSIKEDLEEAEKYLRTSIEATRLAEVTLTSAIAARNDAESASAEKYAGEQWRDAEKKFASAASRLEDGNVNSARSRAADAEKLFRASELMAIKTNYLDEARRLIAKAKDDRVDRYAPKTLAKAESLLAQADRALNEDRYDTDQPRTLARQAKYEAKHAIYLAGVLKPVRDKDVSLEDLALAGEVPVEKIASTLDMVAELDTGYEAPTAKIIEKISELQQNTYELGERRTQIADLESEIQQLEQSLGTQSQRLAAQESQRQLVREIEALFGPNESQVFTQGPNVLIRLIGLNFASGSAQIETRYFPLLRKIQDAVRKFPGALITVEGHTDSFGSDETNLRLSRERAEAVRSYLLANMSDRTTEDVASVGYGETRPVANNETAEGRTKNRRIDLVIRPAG